MSKYRYLRRVVDALFEVHHRAVKISCEDDEQRIETARRLSLPGKRPISNLRAEHHERTSSDLWLAIPIGMFSGFVTADQGEGYGELFLAVVLVVWFLLAARVAACIHPVAGGSCMRSAIVLQVIVSYLLATGRCSGMCEPTLLEESRS